MGMATLKKGTLTEKWFAWGLRLIRARESDTWVAWKYSRQLSSNHLICTVTEYSVRHFLSLKDTINHHSASAQILESHHILNANMATNPFITFSNPRALQSQVGETEQCTQDRQSKLKAWKCGMKISRKTDGRWGFFSIGKSGTERLRFM